MLTTITEVVNVFEDEVSLLGPKVDLSDDGNEAILAQGVNEVAGSVRSGLDNEGVTVDIRERNGKCFLEVMKLKMKFAIYLNLTKVPNHML